MFQVSPADLWHGRHRVGWVGNVGHAVVAQGAIILVWGHFLVKQVLVGQHDLGLWGSHRSRLSLSSASSERRI